MINKLIYPF